MRTKLINSLNSKTFTNIAQSTAAAVTIETVLKATSRPMFIMMDKNTDKETKKYSATKEFLYQLTCLGLYLSVMPLAKNVGYNVMKKIISGKTAEKLKLKGIRKFKNLDYSKFKKEYKNLKTDADKKAYNLAKGVVELSATVNSIIFLTIVAPMLSHIILNPVMKFFGIKKAEPSSQKINKQV